MGAKRAMLWAAAVAIAFATVVGVDFSNSAERTVVTPPTSEVIVTGRVIASPLVQSRVKLEFVSGSTSAAVVKPKANGDYTVTLGVPGLYTVAVQTLPRMNSTYRTCIALAGINVCNVELPPTAISLSIVNEDDAPMKTAVQLELTGPIAPTRADNAGVVWAQDAGHVALVGIEYGHFVITARTADGQTSRAPFVVDVSPTAPEAHGNLVMVRRSLDVAVVDPSGNPIRASVHAVMRELEARDGLFDASKVPDGQELQVKARGFVPVCTFAKGSSGHQRIVMRPVSSNEARIELFGVSTPAGLIHGLPGSRCGVNVSGFRVIPDDIERPDSVGFVIRGVPAGSFRYKAAKAAPFAPLRVPGPALRYEVPSECVVCGNAR